jgi:glycerol-3-phosphate dehydrogenase (NAD(P)+)
MIVSLVKGLEVGSHRRPSEVIAEVAPAARVAALSGPTNALGVARGEPSAMVLAAGAIEPAVERLQQAFSGPTLRVYTSDDLPGVEFGGCLKNIYAIAAGCCDGLRLGDNTKAALLTRALAEMVRVGAALGAQPETFYGLGGFGDLVAGRRTVVEGHRTADSFAGLCAERGIDAPILREVRAILFEGKRPDAALAALMTRGLKRESGGRVSSG